MKWVLVLLLAVSVQPQSITSNFTLPQSLLANLTNLILESLDNDSVTLTEVLSSNAVQELFNYYGYNNLASSVDGLNELANFFSQLEKIRHVLEELAATGDECARQLMMLVTGLSRKDEWAIRMLDASAKLQPGILEGNTVLIGHFDECLKIGTDVNGTQINGQYCTTYVTDYIKDSEAVIGIDVYISLKLASYGLCIPAACDQTSLQRVARSIEESLESPYHLNVAEELCMSSVKTARFTTGSILTILFFTIMVIIVVLSTFYDIFVFQKKTYEDPNIFVAFSFYTNGRKLFSSKKSADSLGCLNGIRVISMVWIVIGHRFLYTTSLPFINSVDVAEWPTLTKSAILTTANMAVDTFLEISGILVVYVYLLHKEKGRTPSLSMYYIHRILRLTPPIAAMVLLYATLLEHIGSGPFWSLVPETFGRNCKDNWWETLLYVQNYVNPSDLCVSQSWYLAVDTQLYFLFPLLLYPLLKRPKSTLAMVICLVAVCCGVSFCISWEKNLEPAFFGMDVNMLKYLYMPTHARASPWLIGILLGYLLFNIRNKIILMNTKRKMFLWSAALAVMVAITAYHKRFSGGLRDMSRLESALANSLIRPLWSLALSIVIFLCVTGNGGVINRILSSSIFTVLIRINYNAYLWHVLVILFSLARKKTPQDGSFTDNLYYVCGDYVFTSLLAVVWTLVFESPILILEKIFFGKRKSREETLEEPERHTNNNIGVTVIDNRELINGKPHV